MPRIIVNSHRLEDTAPKSHRARTWALKNPRKWAVDCHVHLYPGYDLSRAVACSWENLKREFSDDPLGQCWCLTSPPGVDGLALARELALSALPKVRLRDIADANGGVCLLADTAGGPILIVPGTQAISDEKLELLSLGAELPSSTVGSLKKLVTETRKRGGLPVIPWGVGKWLGRRGRVLSAMLDERDDTLILADNANRPWWWPYPALLAKARTEGLIVVSGTDPLPIVNDERRIGSAGIVVDEADIETVWIRARELICASNQSGIRVFGRPMASGSFVGNQIRLRTRSRLS